MQTEYEAWRDELRGRKPSLAVRVVGILFSAAVLWALGAVAFTLWIVSHTN